MSDTTDSNNQAGEFNHDDVIPDHFRKELKEARADAAKYRTEKKEAVAQAREEVEASFKSKVEELEAQIQQQGAELANSRTETVKLKAALQAGIEVDKVESFADLLKGETEEELKSHAEELKKLFVTEPSAPAKRKATDPTQGSQGDPLPLNGDPLLEAITNVINRKR